ncbi:hypothetical protein EPUL_006157 [Erysiphe pulchra]|uniref:Uncharacterized protein n=1 Tax=Erysiphe pulchra TaxID=225359 RepID=A0A2S4PIY9_9PEZI|nr:hypothetical protein EPUL_006157 [Erysiphe pulchra]
MSMIDFYQASPDFSKSCRTLSIRINEKRIKRKKYSEREPENSFEEEILMVETSGSLAKMHIDNDSAPDHSVKCSTLNCNAFRVPGEVLSNKVGVPGRVYLDALMVCADQGSDLVLISPQLVRILNLKKNTLSHFNGHAITMGTADGASHKILVWVSFIFGSGGVNREVHAFVRPDKGITDLFLLLGLPWLHSVKAVIDIQKSQIKLGDRKNGEKRTILQGPTFEFAKYHCLLLQPTKIPFKGVLRTKPYVNEEKVISAVSKRSSALDDENLSKLSGDEILNNDSLSSWDEGSVYSSGSETTVKDIGNKKSHKVRDYISASTDSDPSTEDDYSTDENSSAQDSENSIN